jgi:hypothetical protein
MLAMKSRLCSALVVALMALVFSGCATTSYDSTVLGLSVGMTKSEVIAVMGQPKASKVVNKREFLIWRGVTAFPLSYVEFSDGKAVGWDTGVYNGEQPWHKKFRPDRIELKSDSKIDSTIKIE